MKLVLSLVAWCSLCPLAWAQGAWHQITVGGAGERFNAAARKLKIDMRVVRGECNEASCTYHGVKGSFLASGGSRSEKANEIMVPIGSDTDPMNFLFRMGAIMTMLEPGADREERGAAVSQITRNMGEVIEGKKPAGFDLRSTTIRVYFMKDVGGIVAFSPAQ